MKIVNTFQKKIVLKKSILIKTRYILDGTHPSLRSICLRRYTNLFIFKPIYWNRPTDLYILNQFTWQFMEYYIKYETLKVTLVVPVVWSSSLLLYY